MRKLIIISSIVISACNQGGKTTVSDIDVADAKEQVVDAAELVTWTEATNNFQNKQQQVGDLTYTIMHVSPEFLAIHDLGTEATTEQIDSLKKDYSEMEYFRLKIEAPNFQEELLKYNLESASMYDERVRYCSFDIGHDLTLSVDNGPAQVCGLNHFERTFNVAPMITIMLAFPKQELKNNKAVTITFDDHLFNNGLIRFSWSAEEFSAFPKLANN